MLEDLASDPFVLDHGHQAHRAGTPRTHQNVHRVGTLHERRPIEPSLAAGVVRAYEVVIIPRTNDAVALPKDVHDVRAAELSPDGRVLALLHSDGNRLTALDVANPTGPALIGTVDILPGEHQHLVRALAFSPDGQTVWVVSGPSADTHPQVIPTRITAVRLLAAYAEGGAPEEARPSPPVGPVRRMLAV